MNRWCLLLDIFVPSGKDFSLSPTVIPHHQILSIRVFSASAWHHLFLSSPAPLSCLSSCLLLPIYPPWWKVVIPSFSLAVYFLLYLSNYLSALSPCRSLPPTLSSIYLPLCKISPSATTFIIHFSFHTLPYLIELTPSSFPSFQPSFHPSSWLCADWNSNPSFAGSSCGQRFAYCTFPSKSAEVGSNLVLGVKREDKATSEATVTESPTHYFVIMFIIIPELTPPVVSQNSHFCLNSQLSLFLS